jgi:prophage antirepressor-like protein
MEQEIIDPNCIVKAFQNNNISIIKHEDNKYYFRGSDVAKALEITNIRLSIQIKKRVYVKWTPLEVHKILYF